MDDDGYLLCASPRSGSTLLCDLLIRTGVAGEPRSFFHGPSIARYARSWGLPDDEHTWGLEYAVAARRHGAGHDGRFGMRIMWSDLPGVLQRVQRDLPGEHEPVELLREVFGITRFVHLRREDTLAQAVSLTLAHQTGLWHRNADGSEREQKGDPRPPHYDRTQIAEALRSMEDEQTGWARWFAAGGIDPLAITYEELALQPRQIAAMVLDRLGCRNVELPAVGTAQLSSELNHQWRERFLAESRS